MSLSTSEPRPISIRVDELTVHYRTVTERGGTLRRTLGRRHPEVIEALNGVSFDVHQGTVTGVIGRNGAGKSTMLRAMSGIITPTAGRVELWGRVTPLLTLGVGFNNNLTGRTNITLGGLSLGLDRQFVDEQMDSIISFAELGSAIDRPIRTYSSGMKGRLGFALAAHLDPEIMLIDEALGAGDPGFKERCQAKIDDLCEGKSTIVIVTHGIGLLKSVADNVVWLRDGRMVKYGPTEEVVAEFVEAENIKGAAAAMDDLGETPDEWESAPDADAF